MTKAKKIDLVNLVLKLIGFLQTIIPVFLYAWVEHLRSKGARAEVELSYEKLKSQKKDIEHSIKSNNQSSVDCINDFLRKG